MEMTSLNISLPKPMKEFVEARVLEDQYSTPSEYLRSLIREDQKRQEAKKLEALLLESLQSGEAIEVDSNYWQKKRRNLMQRLEQDEA